MLPTSEQANSKAKNFAFITYIPQALTGRLAATDGRSQCHYFIIKGQRSQRQNQFPVRPAFFPLDADIVSGFGCSKPNYSAGGRVNGFAPWRTEVLAAPEGAVRGVN